MGRGWVGFRVEVLGSECRVRKVQGGGFRV